MSKKTRRQIKKAKERAIEEEKKLSAAAPLPADILAEEKAAVKNKTKTEPEIKKGKKTFVGSLIIGESDNPSAKWYIIHTYAGHEQKVMSALAQRVGAMKLNDKILEALIPNQDRIQIRSGKKFQVTEKIFPGYVLVRMVLDDNSWLAVRTTQGVTGFVGIGDKPTPISQEEVQTIKSFMSLGAPKFQTKFSVGEAVRIVDGPFAEFLGSIEAIDEERGKVKVLVSIFGRETPVELDFLQVKKI